MRFNDLLRVSFRQVLRQRHRYMGVVLTVALGTAGLILIITVGGLVEARFNRDLDLLGGANLIKVRFQHKPGTRPQRFTEATVAAMRSLDHVQGVSLTASKMRPAQTSLGRNLESFQLMAVDGDYWRVHSFLPTKGDLFGRKEVAERQRICVIGGDLARRVYGTNQVTGQNLLIDNDIYRIVGVLDDESLGDRVEMAFVPLTTGLDRIQGMSPPNSIYVRVDNWDFVEEVAIALPEVITSRQDVRGLRILVAWDALRRVQAVAFVVETFVMVAVVASLVLGGFGIWNMMMSAVRSRTREIGLKKAMGAKDREILTQFLTEALSLSLGAAVIGVALGRLGIELICLWLDSRPSEYIFAASVALGLFFAVGLGVGAGLYPSLQASRMEVVHALRYE